MKVWRNTGLVVSDERAGVRLLLCQSDAPFGLPYCLCVQWCGRLFTRWVSLVRYEVLGKRHRTTFDWSARCWPCLTAVAGINPCQPLFSRGPRYGMAQVLGALGYQVAFYNPWVIIVGHSFQPARLWSKTVQPYLKNLAPKTTEVGVSMGASDWTVFRRILFSFPMGRTLMTGIGLVVYAQFLASRRGNFIAGNMLRQRDHQPDDLLIRLRTLIMRRPVPIASVVLMASLGIAAERSNFWWQARYLRRLHGR